MTGKFKTSAATLAIIALTAVPLATGVTLMSATDAGAQANDPGSNGNAGGAGGGNGRGNPPENRGAGNAEASGRGAPGEDETRGRGEIASILGALNAAHASDTALENAAPDSMPGKLQIYKESGGISADDVAEFNELNAQADELGALLDADDDGVIEEGDDAYDASLDYDGDGDLDSDDVSAYEEALADYEDSYEALASLAEDGRLELSAPALEELHSLLGMEPEDIEPETEGETEESSETTDASDS